MSDLNVRRYGDNSNGEFRHFSNSRSERLDGTKADFHLGGGRLDYVYGKNLVHGNVFTSLVLEIENDNFAVQADYTVGSNSAPKSLGLLNIFFKLNN